MKERRREKEEERKQKGNCIPGGKLKVRRGSCIWGSPLTGRKISWENGRFRDSKESPATGLWQARQSETYTDGPCHNPACLSLRWVSASADEG